MTKILETATQEIKVVKEIICDRCGETVSTKGLDFLDPSDWIIDTEVGWNIVYTGPGYANSIGFYVNDLCFGCAEVLYNLLHENGFKIDQDFNWDQVRGKTAK